ncbi:MAG: oxidative damage protection protein, partial [Gammaproteobacteria bacterium]
MFPVKHPPPPKAQQKQNARRHDNKQQQPETTMSKMVKCIKYGEEMEGLAMPPYPGALGQRIFDNVSARAWGEWLEQQKMLMNEYRLNMA